MKVGIDISQIAYQGTGVANYTKNLVKNLLKISAKGGPASGRDKKNEYVFFFSSLRRKPPKLPHLRAFKIPPTILEFLWNRLHICPIEWFIGKVDVFFSSDWMQPPTLKAKKVTTIHDLSVWKFPEAFHSKIVAVHKRRMRWVKKECDAIICDSQATKKDVREILKIPERKIKVIYPGGRC